MLVPRNQSIGGSGGSGGGYSDPTIDQYGAVPDYNPSTQTGTDNTVAIQNALNANAGKTLRMKEGAYLISGKLTVPNGTFLYGHPSALNSNSSPSPLTSGSVLISKQAAFNFLGLGDRCTLNGVAFDAGSSAQSITSGSVIDASNKCGITLQNVKINRAWNGLTISNTIQYYNNVYMDNIEMMGYLNKGFDYYNAVGIFLTKYTLINPTTAPYYGAIGASILQGSATIHFVNGVFYGGGGGVVTNTTAPGHQLTAPDDVHFVNHSSEAFHLDAIQLNNSTNTTLRGCFIGGSTGYGLSVLNGGDAIELVGNNFDRDAISGVYLNTTAKGILIANNNFVSNNYSNSANDHGISIAAGVSDFVITGNRFTNSPYAMYTGHQKYGIYVANGASDRYIITNNLVSGNETGGVYDGGTGVNKNVSNNF